MIDIIGRIKNLITRAKGLDDIHDDLAAHEASQLTNRAVVNDIHTTDLPAVKVDTAAAVIDIAATHVHAAGAETQATAAATDALAAHVQADHIHDTDLPAVKAETALIKTQTDKIAGKMLFSVDYWSVPQVSVVVPIAAASQSLPDVVVAALPASMTVVKATAMFKFRILGNTGAANKLTNAQHIQIQKGGAGGFADAISLVDDQFGIAAATREGGDVVVGDHNVVAKVDANATYNFLWTDAIADVAALTFYDCQTGLRIWYSV